ncbi:hypothetical protein ACFL2P_02760 [Candidatus Moduliflexota bacterium]
MFIVNKHEAYSYNSVTTHFGGDSGQDNFLPIVPGWNYMVRFYQPQKAILDGTWKFPEVKPVAAK